MSYDWDFLNHNEKEYFKNDEILFLDKKKKLLEVSMITNEIKSLHAKIKLIDEGADMQNLAERLVELDMERVKLFEEIDNF